MSEETIYEIRDGVRRAKAAWLCGREAIAAQIDGLGRVIHIQIESLRSPKSFIEDAGPRGGDWGVVYRMTQRGQELPPIVIMPGTDGTPIADVGVADDELELFRQRFAGDP